MTDAPHQIIAWGDKTVRGIVYGAGPMPTEPMTAFNPQAYRRADLPPTLAEALTVPEVRELVKALEAIWEICVEPAETDHKNVRGWIEVTARAVLAKLPGGGE